MVPILIHPVPNEVCPKCRPLPWPPAPPDPAQLGGLGERESGGTGGPLLRWVTKAQ